LENESNYFRNRQRLRRIYTSAISELIAGPYADCSGAKSVRRKACIRLHRLSASYDAKRFEDNSGIFNYEVDREIILELVGMAAPAQVLDLPTGTGRVLDYLSDLDVRVIGCDATQSMLDIAAKRMTPEKHSLLMADAAELPFDDESQECIISLRFFHLFEEETRRRFTREFERVLKQGGHVICSFTNGWYCGGVNWAKRGIGYRTVYFEHRGELKRLFPNFHVRALRGNFLPLQNRVSRSSMVGRALRRLTSSFPLNHVCWEKFYLLQKP